MFLLWLEVLKDYNDHVDKRLESFFKNISLLKYYCLY